MRKPLTLSPRETSVARLMALGHTDKEIAAEMRLRVGTVDTYQGRIAAKIGATNDKSIASLIVALRIVDPGEVLRAFGHGEQVRA